ncbi:hypothetical protein ACP4OV_011058 [Aristida adscensionis]
MTGPGLFSDIGKRATAVLTKGYTHDQKITLSTVTASGVGLTSVAVNKGGLNSLDISAAYKHKNTHVSINVDSESNISASLTVLEALPSTNFVTSVKLPDYIAGELELQYLHENASFAAVFGMKPSLVVEFSGTVGAEGVAFGAKGRYDTARRKLTKFSAGIGVTKQDFHAAFIMADKGDTIKVSGLYHIDMKQKASAVAEFTMKLSTNKNTFTVGGLYKIDPQTTVKVRLSNSGRLAALLQHKVKPKSHVMISGEFNTKALDRPPKFGLAVCYGPRTHEPSRHHGTRSKSRSSRHRAHHHPSLSHQ